MSFWTHENPIVVAFARILTVIGVGLGIVLIGWLAQEVGVPLGFVGDWLDKIPAPW